jgi:hypothetical protein
MTAEVIDFNPWTPEDTEAWLTRVPLPVNFTWPDNMGKERAVLPVNRIHKGYGFWLRTTPYFPGLFEEIHRIIALTPSDVEMSPEWLADQLNKRRPQGTQTGLFSP